MLQQMQGTQAQAQVQAQAQAQAQQAQAQAQVQAQAQAQTGLQSSGIWPPGASRPNPAFSPSLGATAANQHSAGMPSAGSTTIDNQNMKPRPPMPPGNLAQPADSHGNRGSVGFSGQPGLGDLDASKGAAAAPPPISAEEFQRVYLNFCQTNKIQHDERLMFVEGRRVDLYRLHSEVASAGGYAVVRCLRMFHLCLC
jgi:type II secretory pathway pseudopilin PulG